MAANNSTAPTTTPTMPALWVSPAIDHTRRNKDEDKDGQVEM